MYFTGPSCSKSENCYPWDKSLFSESVLRKQTTSLSAGQRFIQVDSVNNTAFEQPSPELKNTQRCNNLHITRCVTTKAKR